MILILVISGQATKMVLKENIKEIVNEVKPVIENVLVKLTEDVLFKTTGKIPFEKLYPSMEQKLRKRSVAYN